MKESYKQLYLSSCKYRIMPQHIYLNTASCGLLSQESINSTYELYKGMQANASAAAEPLRDQGLQRIREMAATFMDAPINNVVFIPNFSYAFNAVVQSLRGDEKILLYNNDYPSLVEPFKVNKFDITGIDSKDGFSIDADELKRILLENKIDILAISHVQWMTGFKIDLDDIGAFCKKHNIIFIVDVTQSLGAIPIYINKLHVDVLIGSNYKWMNAGFGTGIMYISDAFISKYPPVISGSNAYNMAYGTYDPSPSPKCYEPGHLNMHGLLVLEEALKYKLDKGIEAIADHNQRLTQMLLDNIDPALVLGDATAANRSSIVILKDMGGLYDRLTEAGFVCIKRSTGIRIGFHFYNTEEEVQKLISCLSSKTAEV